MRLVASTAVLTLVVACGGPGKDDAAGSTGGGAAVADGRYGLSSVVCLSTGAPPAYPTGAYKAALFAFDDLTAHSFELRGNESIETLQDADCSLAVTRSVARNVGEELSLARDRRHVFAPEGCHLHVTLEGHTIQVGKDTTTLFDDSVDTTEELPLVASRDTASGTTTLTTRDDPVLSELWAKYGCPPGDRLEKRLTP